MTPVLRAIFVLTLTPVSAALVGDGALLQAEAERVALIERTKPPVIAVFAVEGESGGSGVLISPDGLALTNFHVARPCGEWLKCGLSDGRLYDAVIVGVDPVGDVALIKLFGRNDFPAAILGDSDRVQVGDRAYVMGNPFLLAADFQPTVTCGIISGVHRYQFPSGTLLEYADCLQTDASINPGNSGGPLFDGGGLLIGIVGRASFEKRGRVNVGAGYAISINQVRRFLGYLHSGRIVDHATLGATVAFDDAQRVVVTEILDSSDAYRRGLRYDDEIVSLAGRPVTTPNGFKNILGTIPKGWRVPLSFRRDGERLDVLVRLAGVHAEGELLEKLESSRADELPIPQRNPGKDEKPGKTPAPIEPIETAGGNRPTGPDMPEVVKQHLEERAGYANYYFNRQHRTRVLDSWLAKLAPAQKEGQWALSGKTSAEDTFQLKINDKGASIELAENRYDWAATDDLTADLQPEGSGGMLPALYLWRYLATHPVEEFGEVSYLGTAPFPGREDLLDVIVAVRRGLEVWFYFDPNDARLVGLEMWSDPSRDPCEVRFSEYAESSGTPGRIEVIYGDAPFTILTMDARP
ncbi:MAG: trypsin-like serine protease [Planctomycetaceae bacterium]|nr:trypsin-like serine protease [Planctomycetaceae bacterium]